MQEPFAFFLLAEAPEAVKIPLAMLLVFGSAKLLDELFERLGQPGIVGQILGGVLIGPSVLGWVKPDEFLRLLAELGVMFLLFRVGLEIKSAELMKVGGTAALVAILGVLVPFGLGWGLLRLWGEPHVESIFVGAAMVATSVGITAHVLASRNLLAERASKIILAAAVFDDVLGLLILALVSSLAKGKVNFLELGLTALLAISFTFIVARWGTRTVQHVLPRILQRTRASDAQFALAMILLFTLSVCAVYAGVAPIIGAFLAGMALAESLGHRVQLLTRGVAELLTPFFLVGIGLQFEWHAFAAKRTLLLALSVLLAAVCSKLVGCGLGSYRLGPRDALRVGLGMVPRGEVGMVVAQIGLSLGVVSQTLYGVVVFMSVATTVVTPPLLRLAYGASPAAETPLQEESAHKI